MEELGSTIMKRSPAILNPRMQAFRVYPANYSLAYFILGSNAWELELIPEVGLKDYIVVFNIRTVANDVERLHAYLCHQQSFDKSFTTPTGTRVEREIRDVIFTRPQG